MSDDKNDTPKEPEVTAKPTSMVRLADQPPPVLPAIVLEDLVPFPGPVVPVVLDDPMRRDAVLHAKSNSGFFFLVNRKRIGDPARQTVPQVVLSDTRVSFDGRPELTTADTQQMLDAADALDEDVSPELGEVAGPKREPEIARKLRVGDLAPVGIVARVLRVFKLPDDRTSALVHLMKRAQPESILRTEPFPILRVTYPVEIVVADEQFNALSRQLKIQLQAFFEAHTQASDELRQAVLSIEDASSLTDFVAQHLARDINERLEFLTELDLTKRLHKALEVTVRELDLLNVGNRISHEIREKVEKTQREFLLREQLKAIRTELGEEKDAGVAAVDELAKKLDAAGLSGEAKTRADDEMKRLASIPTESPEHNVIRSYLETIAGLPWSKTSTDSRDIKRARAILDEDHYGLDEVKDRIIEFLAVRQLKPDSRGTMLCFAGPPGVGKTSLGQSIARALGRQFYRFSVGGMRDEAEIKGHRRTYIGAMPGRILQGLKQVGTKNPVFMLDEIDKMGHDWRGDPSSAMLEVLDPAQNAAFLDHYLDLPFDLSSVMFIATANVKSEIPGPLLDRMEVIDLPGYIPSEKLEIGMRYLVPRQRKEHGIPAQQLRIGKPAVQRIIGEYTYEAGVRELERQIGKICRKRATQIVQKKSPGGVSVSAEDVPTWLGPPKLHDERLTKGPVPGVVLGLAWTQTGGDVLFIEAALMEGKGNVAVTGQLGEVMSESAKLAVSYVRSHAKELGIDESVFKERDIHIHFPAGAVKKDGPSAGITVTTAVISLLTGKAIRSRLAMTGEMTLRGEVLPVGGIREKVVAARRFGVNTVILPERNRADVAEIPSEVREKVEFVFASRYEQVLDAAFGRSITSVKKPKAAVRSLKRTSTRARDRRRPR